MRVHPYASLPERHFWSTAVARRSFFDIGTLWEPKFPILPRMPISTFGSCFAQHMGQSLKARGFNWFIAERAPYGLSAESARKFNYGIFTARTGNIYTPSLLRQWLAWAMETEPVSDEVWECDGRFFDPFRPNIEPDGFESREEVLQSRSMTLAALRTAVTRSRVLIFTLGLTESWFHAETGVEYPMCPGTVAGVYEAEKHRFVNQDYGQVRTALLAAIHAMRARNPGLKILLTVSPVPLTATLSGNHVLVATMESKSILRAVAGSLKSQFRFVDYFPSYEIINAPPFRGTFFEPNQRNVTPAGVAHVMNQFFTDLGRAAEVPVANVENTPRVRAQSHSDAMPSQADAVCEEELLEAFGPREASR
jgi:hypothetical protein